MSDDFYDDLLDDEDLKKYVPSSSPTEELAPQKQQKSEMPKGMTSVPPPIPTSFDEMDKLHSSLTDMQKQLSAKDELISELRNRVVDLEIRQKNTQQQVTEKENLVSEWKEKAGDLEKKWKDAQREIDNLQKSEEKLKELNHQLMQQLKTTSLQQTQSNTREVEELRKKLAAKEQACSESETHVADLTRKLDALRAEHVELKRELQNAKLKQQTKKAEAKSKPATLPPPLPRTEKKTPINPNQNDDVFGLGDAFK